MSCKENNLGTHFVIKDLLNNKGIVMKGQGSEKKKSFHVLVHSAVGGNNPGAGCDWSKEPKTPC